jgi:2-oxoglutarate dehydrogenase E2 component (dihydrolipoamide succinyltransferase)
MSDIADLLSLGAEIDELKTAAEEAAAKSDELAKPAEIDPEPQPEPAAEAPKPKQKAKAKLAKPQPAPTGAEAEPVEPARKPAGEPQLYGAAKVKAKFLKR